jgi:hypothetical protein
VVTLVRLAALGALALAAGCPLDDRTLTVAGAGGDGVRTDGGGGAGADGASDTPPLVVCQGIAVSAALITDFSDAFPSHNAQGDPDIEFGMAMDGLGGGSYTYHAPFLLPPVPALVSTADGQALAVTATPGVPHDSSNVWSGFGFGISYVGGGCLDASAYSGVQFTVVGNLGTCQLVFGVLFSEDQSVTDNPATGSCPAGAACFSPHSAPLVPDTAGLVRVSFVDMKFNGSPTSTVDPKTITGIQWQLLAPLTGTPCVADFRVDDVSFFP